MTLPSPEALTKLVERLTLDADDQEKRLGSFAGSLILDDTRRVSPMKDEYLSAVTRGMEHVGRLREAAAAIVALGARLDIMKFSLDLDQAKLRQIAEIADQMYSPAATPAADVYKDRLDRIATIARSEP